MGNTQYEDSMRQWTETPGTIEAAVMALTPEERSTGLRILDKLKSKLNAEAAAEGVSTYEWDGCTAQELLEAFEYAEGGEPVG